jgi:hypothetical protein
MVRSLLEFLATFAPSLVAFSVLGLLVAAAISTWFVARMPVDYFLSERRIPAVVNHWAVRLVLVSVKNLVGVVLIVAGLLMLLGPGQGVVTILAGLVLTNFPGKFAAERWLARRKGVLAALNWMRTKSRQPPFEAPD